MTTILASLFSDDRLLTFLSGLGLLALFFWYFATDFERKKRNIGSIIVALIAVFSLLSSYPKDIGATSSLAKQRFQKLTISKVVSTLSEDHHSPCEFNPLLILKAPRCP